MDMDVDVDSGNWTIDKKWKLNSGQWTGDRAGGTETVDMVVNVDKDMDIEMVTETDLDTNTVKDKDMDMNPADEPGYRRYDSPTYG